ncbi:MAG: tetratricopeptide repeat protein [Armatimonadota bacterium]|nr:tetratricopeptide repeat protein [Armatimonadota bacterium]MDW8155608.1 tetratricopeptide repeat protein [Armatimonadota bacterium]
MDDDAHRFYHQGVEYWRPQPWDQAIRAYLQAVRLDPRFVEAWTNLGYTYRKILRRLDPRMADRLLRAIQANDPDLEGSAH